MLQLLKTKQPLQGLFTAEQHEHQSVFKDHKKWGFFVFHMQKFLTICIDF